MEEKKKKKKDPESIVLELRNASRLFLYKAPPFRITEGNPDIVIPGHIVIPDLI